MRGIEAKFCNINLSVHIYTNINIIYLTETIYTHKTTIYTDMYIHIILHVSQSQNRYSHNVRWKRWRKQFKLFYSLSNNYCNKLQMISTICSFLGRDMNIIFQLQVTGVNSTFISHLEETMTAFTLQHMLIVVSRIPYVFCSL